MKKTDNLRKIEKLDDQALKGVKMSNQSGSGSGYIGEVNGYCPDGSTLSCKYKDRGTIWETYSNKYRRIVTYAVACDYMTVHVSDIKYCPNWSQTDGDFTDPGSGSGSGSGDNLWRVPYLEGSGSGEEYVECGGVPYKLHRFNNFGISYDLYSTQPFLVLITQLLRSFHADVRPREVEEYMKRKNIDPRDEYLLDDSQVILSHFFESDPNYGSGRPVEFPIFAWMKKSETVTVPIVINLDRCFGRGYYGEIENYYTSYYELSYGNLEQKTVLSSELEPKLLYRYGVKGLNSENIGFWNQ